MSEDEETLKSAFESNTEKRAVKDIFLALLEVRKIKQPSKEIYEKLTDAFYKYVREKVKQGYASRFHVGYEKFVEKKLSRILFSHTMPYYVHFNISLLHAKKEVIFKPYEYKCFENLNLNSKIRNLHYAFKGLLINDNVDDKSCEEIVKNIILTVQEIKSKIKSNNNAISFDECYRDEYFDKTCYKVPDIILLIAKNFESNSETYKLQDAVAELKKYITEQKNELIEAEKDEEKRIKTKLDELLGKDEELKCEMKKQTYYEPICCCFRKTAIRDIPSIVTDEEYNFGILPMKNDKARYKKIILNKKGLLDKEAFYKNL